MARPIPVLLLVRELGIGGCERDLTKIARNIDRSVFEPHVATFIIDGIRRHEVESAGVPILNLPIRSLLSPQLISHARNLGEYMIRHQIQLLHCFDLPTELIALPVGRWYKVPVLIKVDLWFRELVHVRQRPFQPLTDAIADAIIVNSRAVGDELVTRHGLPAKKIHLCYNGVETSAFYPGPGARRNHSPVVIGTVCALRAEKRLDWLLKAFRQVRDQRPGSRLVVVGSGPVEHELQQLRHDLGLVGDSHFEPMTSDVAGWMRNMDIFVLCSESESFPNALLEAMACGCCPVGSRVGGVPELIDEGRTGLIFNPGNVADLAEKLVALTDNATMRRSFGEAAAKRAAEVFPIAANVRRTQEIYSALLRQKADLVRRNGFEPPAGGAFI